MKSLSTLLTTLLTIAALFALTGWQVTSETAATRLLGRLASAMIEIDRWLPAHEEDLQLLARDRTDGVILVRDLPIEVTLPSAVVLEAQPGVIEALIRQEMGRQLYEDGNSAFKDNDGNTASLGINEPVRWTVMMLGSGMHGFWTAALILTLLLALAAAASVMTTGETPVHAIATGAVIGAIASLGFYLLMHLVGSMASSAVDKETVMIIKDGAWIGVRNCGGVALASGVLAFLLGMGRGQRSRPRYAPATSRTDSPFS